MIIYRRLFIKTTDSKRAVKSLAYGGGFPVGLLAAESIYRGFSIDHILSCGVNLLTITKVLHCIKKFELLSFRSMAYNICKSDITAFAILPV
jgi:hypothetical protein